MNFNEYQDKASETAQFERTGLPAIIYVTLGLAGETGELVEKIKKAFRNDGGAISDGAKEDIKREMGDVLWYLSQSARALDIDFDDVATANLTKLKDRQERDTIKSEGDYR